MIHCPAAVSACPLRARWSGVEVSHRCACRTRSGMQIKVVHSASKLLLAGGRLPRRTIIPLAATASRALPAVASHAVGFADPRRNAT
jgi:hypothetical protein